MKTINEKEPYQVPEISLLQLQEANMICGSAESGFNIEDPQDGYDL